MSYKIVCARAYSMMRTMGSTRVAVAFLYFSAIVVWHQNGKNRVCGVVASDDSYDDSNGCGGDGDAGHYQLACEMYIVYMSLIAISTVHWPVMA